MLCFHSQKRLRAFACLANILSHFQDSVVQCKIQEVVNQKSAPPPLAALSLLSSRDTDTSTLHCIPSRVQVPTRIRPRFAGLANVPLTACSRYLLEHSRRAQTPIGSARHCLSISSEICHYLMPTSPLSIPRASLRQSLDNHPPSSVSSTLNFVSFST